MQINSISLYLVQTESKNSVNSVQGCYVVFVFAMLGNIMRKPISYLVTIQTSVCILILLTYAHILCFTQCEVVNVSSMQSYYTGLSSPVF